jgi:hypothetical protein
VEICICKDDAPQSRNAFCICAVSVCDVEGGLRMWLGSQDWSCHIYRDEREVDIIIITHTTCEARTQIFGPRGESAIDLKGLRVDVYCFRHFLTIFNIQCVLPWIKKNDAVFEHGGYLANSNKMHEVSRVHKSIIGWKK